MSAESATLKIRVRLPDNSSYWGRDCYIIASGLIGDGGNVLDAKWGREPTKWHETGGGWGRVRLTAEERGYIAGLTDAGNTSPAVDHLVAIIERLTGYAS